MDGVRKFQNIAGRAGSYCFGSGRVRSGPVRSDRVGSGRIGPSWVELGRARNFRSSRVSSGQLFTCQEVFESSQAESGRVGLDREMFDISRVR